MVQIGTIGRVGTARAAAKPPERPPAPIAASRALVAIAGGRSEAPQDGPDRDAPRQKARGGTRPLAGFLTQMIVDADPTLRPSRLERTGLAAARYAETARLTA